MNVCFGRGDASEGIAVFVCLSLIMEGIAADECLFASVEKGEITVDGRVVNDPNIILSAGSELVYHRLPWKEPDVPYLLEVFYEDDDLIALNKPSGLQVLPGGLFQQRTVLKQLQWRASKQSSSLSSQASHPVPVHRLGRGTSGNVWLHFLVLWSIGWFSIGFTGILLCAKTKLAKTCIAAYFADKTSVVDADNTVMELSQRKITKIYRALVHGIVDEDKPIGIVRYPGVAKGLYVASPSGKPALSKVDVLERDVQRNCTLVQVEIQSGRPHQIRIHLAFLGHPLLGDPLYVAGGQPKSFDSEFADGTFAQDGGYERPVNPVPGDCGYYLHAYQLFLSHPTTNEVIKITAPLPSVLKTREEGREVDKSVGSERIRGIHIDSLP
ncbi:RNA pseudouridine synthase 5 [Citrus sinensis]|nr:RNA pseudouridine synthase 5 [Citrus sinensis]